MQLICVICNWQSSCTCFSFIQYKMTQSGGGCFSWEIFSCVFFFFPLKCHEACMTLRSAKWCHELWKQPHNSVCQYTGHAQYDRVDNRKDWSESIELVMPAHHKSTTQQDLSWVDPVYGGGEDQFRNLCLLLGAWEDCQYESAHLQGWTAYYTTPKAQPIYFTSMFVPTQINVAISRCMTHSCRTYDKTRI